MSGRYRPRKEIKLWLYKDIAEEIRLLDYIVYLKKTRQFAETIRSGLRLMWSLREGDTSVLFELFPGLRQSLQPPPGNDGGGNLERHIEELKAIIQEYRRDSIPIDAPLVAAPALKSAISSRDETRFQLPEVVSCVIDDDDQDTIVLNRSTSNQGTANFLAAMASFE